MIDSEKIISQIKPPALKKYTEYIVNKKFNNMARDYPQEYKVMFDMIEEGRMEYHRLYERHQILRSSIKNLEEMVKATSAELRSEMDDMFKKMMKK